MQGFSPPLWAAALGLLLGREEVKGLPWCSALPSPFCLLGKEDCFLSQQF